jgi:hypothetical protein
MSHYISEAVVKTAKAIMTKAMKSRTLRLKQRSVHGMAGMVKHETH